jgi:hypothetical protein
MLLRYFLNDFEMVPVAPIITGITSVFTFHILYFTIRFFSLKSFRLLSPSHFYLLKLQYLQHTCSFFIITDYNVRIIVRRGSVGFELVDSIIWLPYLCDLFLLILVHTHTSVPCLVLPYFLAYVKA